MKFRLLVALSLLSLTACTQGARFVTPGGFDANKTASGGEKAKEGSDDASGIDKIIATDSPPPPASTPPPGSPPLASVPSEVTEINAPPTGGDSEQRSSSEDQMVMAFRGPIEPKNDEDNVGSGPPQGSSGGAHRSYRLRYGPEFSNTVESTGSDPFLLAPGGLFRLNLLLEKIVRGAGDARGNVQFSWVTEPDGPQVRIVLHPEGKQEWEAKFCDVRVSHAQDGSNVSFSDLHAAPGYASFYVFERQDAAPTLPEWLPFGAIANQPTYETNRFFHECDLIPFTDKESYYDAYISGGFSYAGDLPLSLPLELNRAIRSFPQSAP